VSKGTLYTKKVAAQGPAKGKKFKNSGGSYRCSERLVKESSIRKIKGRYDAGVEKKVKRSTIEKEKTRLGERRKGKKWLCEEVGKSD